MVPTLAGAIALIVKAAVPVGAPDTKPDDSVTLQFKVAPAADGRVPQLTALTPAPTDTEFATTPAGSASEIRADVPDTVPPSLPKPSV